MGTKLTQEAVSKREGGRGCGRRFKSDGLDTILCSSLRIDRTRL